MLFFDIAIITRHTLNCWLAVSWDPVRHYGHAFFYVYLLLIHQNGMPHLWLCEQEFTNMLRFYCLFILLKFHIVHDSVSSIVWTCYYFLGQFRSGVFMARTAWWIERERERESLEFAYHIIACNKICIVLYYSIYIHYDVLTAKPLNIHY